MAKHRAGVDVSKWKAGYARIKCRHCKTITEIELVPLVKLFQESGNFDKLESECGECANEIADDQYKRLEELFREPGVIEHLDTTVRAERREQRKQEHRAATCFMFRCKTCKVVELNREGLYRLVKRFGETGKIACDCGEVIEEGHKDYKRMFVTCEDMLPDIEAFLAQLDSYAGDDDEELPDAEDDDGRNIVTVSVEGEVVQYDLDDPYEEEELASDLGPLQNMKKEIFKEHKKNKARDERRRKRKDEPPTNRLKPEGS